MGNKLIRKGITMKNKRGILLGLIVLLVVITSAVTFLVTKNAVTTVSGAETTSATLPDTYAHATSSSSKKVLTGEELENALQFLADSSHYLYINRATPYYGNYHLFPETGFDTGWRSPVNGRGYRGPYNDPITRSVNWLTTNPNGSSNSSIGSYWACLPPNTELELNNNELQGYSVQPDWQIVSYMAPGQTVNNFIRNGRGSFLIDAALVSNYGLPNAWKNRNMLNVEVKLRNYVPRVVTPQQYYDGGLPTTSSWLVPPRWLAVPGWGPDAGDNQFRTVAQFWGVATGDDAALNFTTDEERTAYIERANADPVLLEALTGCVIDLHFDIVQIVNVTQELGFDFEQGSGKVNGIDKDGDGLLDRYPEGHKEAGELILQNAYGVKLLPTWAYGLNFNLDWWVAADGSGDLFNSQGMKIVGANPDGTYILGGEESGIRKRAGDQGVQDVAVELADNEKLGSANGMGGNLTVKVTMDGETITAVEVVSHSETDGIADPAIEKIPAAIVAQNSTDVDTVAGATITSTAIKQAVQNAIAK